MTESEFLERFDAHIVRMDEHLVESRGLMGEVRLAVGEVREEMRLSREQHADLRAFSRDLTRRNEVVLGEMVSSLAEVRSDLSDLGAQTRAHTEALLSVLDRLN